jgi:hypothetical protein
LKRRQTSIPETLGSIQSSMITSGATSSTSISARRRLGHGRHESLRPEVVGQNLALRRLILDQQDLG